MSNMSIDGVAANTCCWNQSISPRTQIPINLTGADIIIDLCNWSTLKLWDLCTHTCHGKPRWHHLFHLKIMMMMMMKEALNGKQPIRSKVTQRTRTVEKGLKLQWEALCVHSKTAGKVKAVWCIAGTRLLDEAQIKKHQNILTVWHRRNLLQDSEGFNRTPPLNSNHSNVSLEDEGANDKADCEEEEEEEGTCDWRNLVQ